MIIEQRQQPRTPPTCLIATPKAKPVCTIIKGMTPPLKRDGTPQKGIFIAFSPLVRRVVVGSDYIDAFLKYNGMARVN